MAKFYVICDDDCRYEGMTKEEILTAIEQALEQGYVSDPDGAVFSKIKEARAGASVQMWVGTEAEFNAISPVPDYGKSLVRVGADGVLYLCSDDTSLDFINAIAEGGGVYSRAEVDEMIAGINVEVDSEVTEDGTKPVSGAAVAAYAQPKATASTDDLTAGTSPLATGEVYMVYE